jgi:hypothetical protein
MVFAVPAESSADRRRISAIHSSDSGGSASSAEAGVVVDQTDAIGFQSPSGNIRCLYDAITDAVSCHVKNLGKTVSLDSNGKAFDVGNIAISNQSQVVQYGSVWKR